MIWGWSWLIWARVLVLSQVTRAVRGSGNVWLVAPIGDSTDFVAKLLDIHDFHALRQWLAMSNEQKILASGSAEDAMLNTPPSDLALTYDYGEDAWHSLVEWMDEQGMMQNRQKSSRRTAAAAICHAKVGDKRVAMWIMRFGSHRTAVEFFERERLARALAHSQGSAEPPLVAQARRKRVELRLADATRFKMKLANCGSGSCRECGWIGTLFECIACKRQKCHGHCQVVIRRPDPRAGQYLVCKQCYGMGAPLEFVVPARLTPHDKPEHCEAYCGCNRICPRTPVQACRHCHRWNCELCGSRVCVSCPAKVKHNAVQWRAPGKNVWSSVPAHMRHYLYMTDAQFDEEVRMADEMTLRASTGGRFLGEEGFQSAGRTGRGVVFQADAD